MVISAQFILVTLAITSSACKNNIANVLVTRSRRSGLQLSVDERKLTRVSGLYTIAIVNINALYETLLNQLLQRYTSFRKQFIKLNPSLIELNQFQGNVIKIKWLI